MMTQQRSDTPTTADFLARMRREWRPTAAMWVAATGAFLMVAAAGLFVAVRWDQIPDEVKLGIVVALTGGFLFAGHALRKTLLPATGAVLFHLGAFLIPVDVAAVAQRLDVDWTQLLLLEGVIAVLAWAALGTFGNSVVLMRASAVAVVAAALGVGATTPVPAPLALSIAALAATFAGPVNKPVIAWATAAGLMPVVALSMTEIAVAPSPLFDLGLPAAHSLASAVITGVVAGTVLAVAARQRRDTSAAFLAIVLVLIGPVVALADLEATAGQSFVAIAGLFLLVQVAAILASRDEFWAIPARSLAVSSEVLSSLAVLAAIPSLLVALILEGGLFGFGGPSPDVETGIGFALVAGGLLAGIARRIGDPRRGLEVELLTIGAAMTAVAAVVEITTNPVAVGLALAATAIPVAIWSRPGTQIVAIGAALWAPAVIQNDPLIELAATAIIGTGLVLAALQHGGRHLPLAAAATVGLGVTAASGVLGDALAGTVFMAFTIGTGALLHTRDAVLGQFARYASLAAAPFAIAMGPADGLAVAAILTAGLMAEHVRLADRHAGLAAAVTVQLAVVQGCVWAGLSIAQTGIVLTVSSLVWAGLSETAREIAGTVASLRPVFLAATLSAATLGLGLAATEPRAFAAALVVTGGLTLAAGISTRIHTVGHIGGGMVIAGLWIQLGLEQVTAAEAYVAPVAAHLLAAGYLARRSAAFATTSWIAYAPAVAILGGAALLERIDGGAGWHAVVAGTVAAGAVLAGGMQRLAGPLFTGTALLVALVGYESLAVVASVPTWAWLAAGGTALLGAGIAMERTSTSPMDAGRRVIEVVNATFD